MMNNSYGSVSVEALLKAKHHFQSAHNSALISYYVNEKVLKEHHYNDMMNYFEKAASALGFTLTPIVADPWQPETKTDEVAE